MRAPRVQNSGNLPVELATAIVAKMWQIYTERPVLRCARFNQAIRLSRAYYRMHDYLIANQVVWG